MKDWIDIASTEQHPEELSLHTTWHECQHPDWQINPHLRREISTRSPVSKDTTIRIKHADYFGDHYENAVVPAGDTCSVEITDPSASQSVHEEVIETTTRRIDTTTGQATTTSPILVDIPIGITAVLQVLDTQYPLLQERVRERVNRPFREAKGTRSVANAGY